VLSRLRARLYYLSVIVTMAPLLGLLGTISGMISAFSVFNVQTSQASAITGGVGEALVATAFGLCVAILALVVHAYFTQRVDCILTDMEECCSLVESHVAASEN
jgi:biopolymer transport protein ExbB